MYWALGIVLTVALVGVWIAVVIGGKNPNLKFTKDTIAPAFSKSDSFFQFFSTIFRISL